MSDENPYDDLPDPEPSNEAKSLRKAAEEGAKARAEADAIRRELAFVKAGIDTDSKIGQMLLKTYEGDLNVEAIKKEALEIGALKAEAKPEPVPFTADPEDVKFAEERRALATGASVPDAVEPDPYQTAHNHFEGGLKRGMSNEDAMAAAIGVIREAAMKNDSRVFRPQ